MDGYPGRPGRKGERVGMFCLLIYFYFQLNQIINVRRSSHRTLNMSTGKEVKILDEALLLTSLRNVID